MYTATRRKARVGLNKGMYINVLIRKHVVINLFEMAMVTLRIFLYRDAAIY